ncbi:hypothetical protein MASR1M97_16470 [Candidatus Desulfobacillus denitrificans]
MAAQGGAPGGQQQGVGGIGQCAAAPLEHAGRIDARQRLRSRRRFQGDGVGVGTEDAEAPARAVARRAEAGEGIVFARLQQAAPGRGGTAPGGGRFGIHIHGGI